MSHTLAPRPAATAQRTRGGRGQVRSSRGAPTQTRFEPGIARGKTIQTRPTQSANRGRGITSRRTEVRGKAAMDPYQDRQFQDREFQDRQGMGHEEEVVGLQGNSPERRAVYAGCYTMISPDEKKRQQINEMAEREGRQYEEYKQRNKVTRVSYIGTVGGGQTERGARQQQGIMQQSLNKTNRLLRDQERKAKQKEAEERELTQKKEAARRQSELNVQRQKEKKEQWKDEMRRVNQDFLDRLEAKTKSSEQQSAGHTVASYQNRLTDVVKSTVTRTPQAERDIFVSSSGTSASEAPNRAGRQRSELTGTTGRGNYIAQDALADTSSMYGRENLRAEKAVGGRREHGHQDFPAQAGRGGMLADLDADYNFDQAYGCSDFQYDEEFNHNVEELHNMLPQFDRLVLSNALEAANGSIDDALKILDV